MAAGAAVAVLLTGSASAYDVMISNCTGNRLTVITFDEKDLVRMIPFAEWDIAPQSSAMLKCVGTTGCYIRVFYGGFGGTVEDYETGAPLYIQHHWFSGLYRVPSCDHR